jgi:two-component system, NtrC family, nitrogen regulation sensor histidine kinase NtrY
MRNFRINCILRILLISLTIFLFFYILYQTNLYITIIIIGSVIPLQVYSLIHYIEKTNRDLTRLLESIKYDDFSQTFINKGLGSAYRDLYSAFTNVINDFRKIRTEKEEHYNYLQTVVHHVGIGLISFRENGDVDMINNAAKKLLKTGKLSNVKSLDRFSTKLVETLFQLKSGERSLVKVKNGADLLQLAIYSTEFIMREHKYTLVSIQNIQSELEEKEMEAWQNLIRVLTHEIMNSVTPITSLASTVDDMLSDVKGEQKNIVEVNYEIIQDVLSSIRTIHRRSEGLIHFVDSFRKIARVPKPDFQIFYVSEIFFRVEQLMSKQLSDKHIRLEVKIEPENLELTADQNLIEQVLINLLLNSIQSLDSQPDALVQLKASMDSNGRVLIEVKDNGPGIIEEVLEKIFIPFFTTKKDGSGIGLSLSRQIMRLHKGSIDVYSVLNKETVFTLKF